MNAENATKRMLSSLDPSTWPIAIAAGLSSDAERSSVSAEVAVALDMERERAADLVERERDEWLELPALLPPVRDLIEERFERLLEQIRSGDDG